MQLKANASEYLCRRQKEPGDVYGERLSHVFYENYIGSIVDWSIVAIGAVMIVLVFTNVIFHSLGADIAWTTELSELLRADSPEFAAHIAAERAKYKK